MQLNWKSLLILVSTIALSQFSCNSTRQAKTDPNTEIARLLKARLDSLTGNQYGLVSKSTKCT